MAGLEPVNLKTESIAPQRFAVFQIYKLAKQLAFTISSCFAFAFPKRENNSTNGKSRQAKLSKGREASASRPSELHVVNHSLNVLPGVFVRGILHHHTELVFVILFAVSPGVAAHRTTVVVAIHVAIA